MHAHTHTCTQGRRARLCKASSQCPPHTPDLVKLVNHVTSKKRGKLTASWQNKNIMTKAAAQSFLPRPLLEKPIHPKSVPKWVTVKQEKEKSFVFVFRLHHPILWLLVCFHDRYITEFHNIHGTKSAVHHPRVLFLKSSNWAHSSIYISSILPPCQLICIAIAARSH